MTDDEVDITIAKYRKTARAIKDRRARHKREAAAVAIEEFQRTRVANDTVANDTLERSARSVRLSEIDTAGGELTLAQIAARNAARNRRIDI
ncbi:MAG: hypothetical protein WAM97_08720 [Acidimicrobiales bacterium]